MNSLREIEQSPSSYITSPLGNYWQKVNSYLETEKIKLPADAITLSENVLANSTFVLLCTNG